MKKNHESKDTAMNVRLSTSQKKKYMEEARACNMTLSNYVLHILQNKKVTVIKNGSEIAQAMYDLNNTLNQCLKCPEMSLESARMAVTNSVGRLNNCMEKMQGDCNVNTKI